MNTQQLIDSLKQLPDFTNYKPIYEIPPPVGAFTGGPIDPNDPYLKEHLESEDMAEQIQNWCEELIKSTTDLDINNMNIDWDTIYDYFSGVEYDKENPYHQDTMLQVLTIVLVVFRNVRMTREQVQKFISMGCKLGNQHLVSILVRMYRGTGVVVSVEDYKMYQQTQLDGLLNGHTIYFEQEHKTEFGRSPLHPAFLRLCWVFDEQYLEKFEDIMKAMSTPKELLEFDKVYGLSDYFTTLPEDGDHINARMLMWVRDEGKLDVPLNWTVNYYNMRFGERDCPKEEFQNYREMFEEMMIEDFGEELTKKWFDELSKLDTVKQSDLPFTAYLHEQEPPFDFGKILDDSDDSDDSE